MIGIIDMPSAVITVPLTWRNKKASPLKEKPFISLFLNYLPQLSDTAQLPCCGLDGTLEPAFKNLMDKCFMRSFYFLTNLYLTLTIINIDSLT
jgi:hypothetical protein